MAKHADLFPRTLGVALVLSALLAGCASSETTTEPNPSADPTPQTASEPGQAQFVDGVDHRFFPLSPGMRWEYRVDTPEGSQDVLVAEVLNETRVVAGVTTVVVRVTLTVDGELEEETLSWYAQHDDGSVWLFGEIDHGYESGSIVETTTWEAGIEGAEAGVVIPGTPVAGEQYRVGYVAGEVEEMARIVDLSATVDVAAGVFSDVLVIENWSDLEPEIVERKSYAPGVGFVHQVSDNEDTDVVELVSFIE